VAAYEPGGLRPDRFAGYHTVARTLDAFRAAYDQLATYLA
jgi:hypothetical protein